MHMHAHSGHSLTAFSVSCSVAEWEQSMWEEASHDPRQSAPYVCSYSCNRLATQRMQLRPTSLWLVASVLRHCYSAHIPHTSASPGHVGVEYAHIAIKYDGQPWQQATKLNLVRMLRISFSYTASPCVVLLGLSILNRRYKGRWGDKNWWEGRGGRYFE